jgi:hypothetical protein
MMRRRVPPWPTLFHLLDVLPLRPILACDLVIGFMVLRCDPLGSL